MEERLASNFKMSQQVTVKEKNNKENQNGSMDDVAVSLLKTVLHIWNTIGGTFPSRFAFVIKMSLQDYQMHVCIKNVDHALDCLSIKPYV